MNINFGLFTGMETGIRDKQTRNQAIIQRALAAQAQWLEPVD